MPLYSFKCDVCGYTLDTVTTINDRDQCLTQPCPECSCKERVRRVYEAAAIIDKGILEADRNMERSGVLDNLNRLKHHFPEMKWKG